MRHIIREMSNPSSSHQSSGIFEYDELRNNYSLLSPSLTVEELWNQWKLRNESTSRDNTRNILIIPVYPQKDNVSRGGDAKVNCDSVSSREEMERLPDADSAALEYCEELLVSELLQTFDAVKEILSRKSEDPLANEEIVEIDPPPYNNGEKHSRPPQQISASGDKEQQQQQDVGGGPKGSGASNENDEAAAAVEIEAEKGLQVVGVAIHPHSSNSTDHANGGCSSSTGSSSRSNNNTSSSSSGSTNAVAPATVHAVVAPVLNRTEPAKDFIPVSGGTNKVNSGPPLPTPPPPSSSSQPSALPNTTAATASAASSSSISSSNKRPMRRASASSSSSSTTTTATKPTAATATNAAGMVGVEASRVPAVRARLHL